MPHVILRGTLDFSKFIRSFDTERLTENDWLIKFKNIFISKTCKQVLFESVSIRSGFVQNYYILTETKGEQITVRVDPHTNVEKNEGIKRCILFLAHSLLTFAPSKTLFFERTNIDKELIKDNYFKDFEVDCSER